MRALCASIISAGALVGLGLAAIGVGMRYQSVAFVSGAGNTYVRWNHLDVPMQLILVLLVLTLLSALAATFLGLAYHHERRHFERHGHAAGTTRTDALRN